MLAQGNEAKYSIKQVSCQPHRNWASPSIGQLVAVGLMILYMSYMVVYSSGMPHKKYTIQQVCSLHCVGSQSPRFNGNHHNTAKLQMVND